MTLLPDWLTYRADLTPDATAIEIPATKALHCYSWRDIADLVAQTAARLTAQGVKEGDYVAVLMGNGLPFVLAIHALIQCRAILVPLNTRLTPIEIAWQVADVRATHLLYDNSTATLAHEVVAQTPSLSALNLTDAPLATSETAALPSPAFTLDLEQVHAILYTSGTTGKPKGVRLTYGNHWWSAMGSAVNLGLHEADKWLLLLPLFHVGGMSMLFKSVLYGNTLQVYERFDVAAVNHALDHDGITHISLVATMLQRMLDARQDAPYPVTLRAVLLGGGPCPAPLLERCARLGIPVVQTYGMTETASQAVTLPPRDALRKIGSAGKPLSPTALRIEHEGRPAAPNEVGEIVLRGPTITTGYLNRPDATAQTLRDGWLYTGDLGYVDEEGYLYVVNRRTDLIISGGENIYPAEVEAALLTHPDVAEVVVVGVPHDQWGQQVAAAVVLAEGATLTTEALLHHTRSRLAGYKVPRQLTMVAEIPRNAGGKVVRDKVKEFFSA